MNGPVFSVIFLVGLAASLFSLGLIGLTVFLWARDVWVTHRIHRMSEIRRMDRLRELGDRKRQSTLDMWDDAMDRLGLCSPLADETRPAREDAAFNRTLDEIQSLPIANPLDVM